MMADKPQHPEPNNRTHQLFDQAVKRLLANEPFDLIVEQAPDDLQYELAEYLEVVQLMQRVSEEPAPAPANRAANKASFLAQARTMREQSVAAANGAQPPVAQQPRPVTPPPRPGLLERIFGGLTLRSPMPSLAAIALLMVVLLGVTTSVRAAVEDALPGDRVYAVKEAVRRHELALAPPSETQALAAAQDEDRANEIQQAAHNADLGATFIQEVSEMTFIGDSPGVYQFGSAWVSKSYQPDPNIEAYVKTTVIGDLQPGARVEVTYRIIPAQSATSGKPLVQGVELRVIAPPPAPPAPTATPRRRATATPVPVVVPPAATQQLSRATPITEVTEPTATAPYQPTPIPACVPNPPRGWVAYIVTRYDRLIDLADGDPIVAAQIIQVNCLPEAGIIGGITLYIPAYPAASTPVATPTIVQPPGPLTPIAQTPAATATIPPDMTPLATATPSPTDGAAATVTSESTPDPTSEPTADATMTAAPTEEVIVIPGTGTPGVTPAVTAQGTPPPATVATADATATPFPTAAGTIVPTATQVQTSPTPADATAIPITPTRDPDVPTPQPTSDPVESVTPLPGETTPPTATSEGTPQGTPSAPPAATTGPGLTPTGVASSTVATTQPTATGPPSTATGAAPVTAVATIPATATSAPATQAPTASANPPVSTQPAQVATPTSPPAATSIPPPTAPTEPTSPPAPTNPPATAANPPIAQPTAAPVRPTSPPAATNPPPTTQPPATQAPPPADPPGDDGGDGSSGQATPVTDPPPDSSG